jgi:hypothetical protein
MKYNLLYLIFGLFASQLLYCQTNYSKLIEEGDLLYKEQKYDLALEKYFSAFRIKENNSTDLYNGACNAALSGQSKIAVNLLNKSIDNGYFDNDHMEKDCDLYSLHSLPEWKILLAKIDIEKSKVKTEEEIFKGLFINDTIINIAYDLFCTNDFKSKNTKNDFETKRNLISNLIKKNNIQQLEDIENRGFAGQSYSYDPITQILKRYNFKIAPVIFGVKINNYLMTKTGYTILTEYSTIKNNTLINKFEVKNPDFIDPSTNIVSKFDKFITTIDTCHFRFGIFNNEKIALGSSSTISNKNKIIRLFKELKYVKNVDFSVFDSSKRNMYISFFTGDSEKSCKINKLGFPIQQTFEFIFFDNIDIIFVSIDGHYGFYRMTNINKVKNFMTDLKKTIL